MSWRKITFIIVALIVLLGGSAALSKLFISMKPEPSRRPNTELKRSVKAETVTYSVITSSVSASGRVVSGSEVMLVSEASGRIEKGEVTLRKGASFTKGKLIATIYKDEVELALKAKKSKFLNSLTNILPDLKVDYPDQYDLFLNFFNSLDIEKEMAELPAVNNEKLKIFLASRSILSEYYGIKQDEKRLSRHSLYAPFNGTFTLVNFEVGAYVNTGGQIARMIRTDQLEIEVPVENYQSEWIKIGDKVNVYSADPKDIQNGIVVRKASFVDIDTQSRSIFVKVKNAKGRKLLAGEYKMVEFSGQEIKDVMEMPRNSVFNSNEVFIVVEGKLKKKEINILKWNEETLIFNGLDEGAKLVVEPLINVQENSLVEIQGEEAPKQSQGKLGKSTKSNS